MSRLRIQHRREAWIGNATPVSGPAFDWSTIDFAVIHYPGHGGVPDGDPGEHADDLPAFIRKSQEASIRTRGYSYYYGVLVDWLGGTWEVRGDTFRNAANAPAAFNARSIAIQAMIDVGDTTTEYADAAIADLVAQIRAIRPNVQVIPHCDGVKHFAGATATACCGSPLVAKVRSGLFGRPPVIPPPTDEEYDMTKTEFDALMAKLTAVERSNDQVRSIMAGFWTNNARDPRGTGDPNQFTDVVPGEMAHRTRDLDANVRALAKALAPDVKLRPAWPNKK